MNDIVSVLNLNTISGACANSNAINRVSSLVIKVRQSAVVLVVITYSTLVCCESSVVLEHVGRRGRKAWLKDVAGRRG